MKLTRTSLRFPLSILAGFALLIGCQLGSDPDPVASSAITAKGTVEYTEALRLPDSGVWRTNNASRTDGGQGKVVCSPVKANGRFDCSQTFELKSALGSDNLLQDVYALGVHFATLSYSQTGTLPQLNYLGNSSVVLLPMERMLVLEFNKSFKDSTRKPTPTDLVAYYAKLLLNADSLVVGSGLPKGMVPDTVKKILVQVAAQEGVTAKVLAAKALLGLTDETIIRSLTDALIKAGVQLDTAKLYPPVPVRMAETVKIATDVTEGEAAVAVSGAFTWEPSAKIRKAEAKVVTAAGVVDDSVRVNFEKFFDPSAGSWVLTNNVTIRARMGATIGTDTLIVTVVGDSASATSKTPFKVLRGDTTRPSLSITEPAPGTEVPNATEKIQVAVQATDLKGIAEIKIGNTVLTTAPYTAEVGLAVGYNIIAVQAKDNSGNISHDTVVVLRAKSTTSTDEIDPVITLKTPDKDTTVVATGLPSMELSWSASDNVGLKSVTLNEAEVAGTEGVYSKSVPLHDGNNVFEIKAFDDAGNAASKTLVIQRPSDLSKPGISPPSDQTVGADVATLKLTWTITNSHKATKITLNGTEVTLGAEFTSEVTLKPGPNAFTVVVTEASGATVTETVIITRTVLVVLPSIAPVADKAVGADTDTATLTWAITNPDKAKSATLNGEPIAVGASITKLVNLDPGPNVFKLVLKDSSGTEVSSSTTITRAIDTALLALSRPADYTVAPQVTYDTLTWTVFNSAKAVSGTLNGKPVVVGSTIMARVDLTQGSNTFVLVLTDAKGGTVSDTVIVARAADVTGPGIVWVSPAKSVDVDATVTTYAVQVKVSDASGVDSVWLNGALTKPSTTGEYAMTLALPKPDGNPVKVIVAAWDTKGNVSKDSITVTRKVPDGTNKPIIKLVEPTTATGNTLPFATAVLHIEAEITDALLEIDPKSVLIGGVAATATGKVFAADVPVPPSGAPFTITIKASNTGDIASTLDVVVTRAKDAVKPVITPDEATKTQSVGFGTNSLALSWAVSDNHKVATILYQGLSIPVTATVKQTLALNVGANPVKLVAIDSTGNKDSVELVVTRSQDIAATPVFKPAGGTYTSMQSVTITSATTGAKIYYTTDGTIPTALSTLYAGAFNVGASKTIKAIAIAAGFTNSAVATEIYEIDYLPAAVPTFSKAAGTFDAAQSVTIASATKDAVIYYTTDGKDPTTASDKYSTAISITKNTTLKAIATAPGFVTSSVASAAYKIRTAAPTFSVAAGTSYTTNQNVVLSSATTGASIYFTTDGTVPASTATGTTRKYSTAITVGQGETTINAIAVASDLENSAVATAAYTVTWPTLAAPVITSPEVTGTRTVTITAEAGAKIYYSTTGTATTGSTEYTAPFTVSKTITVSAIATKAGSNNSPPASKEFAYTPPVATLASITITYEGVTGSKVFASPASAISFELPIFTSAATISVVPTDPNAKIDIVSSSVSFASSNTAEVTITVTNGTIRVYKLDLSTPTSGTFTDNRLSTTTTSTVYPVGKVGGKWWLLRNLDYGGPNMWTGVGICIDDTFNDCKEIGRSYTFADANASSTCPSGWHLPSVAEFSAVKDFSAELSVTPGYLYWTSDSEADSYWAYVFAGYRSARTSTGPEAELPVRCVRN